MKKEEGLKEKEGWSCDQSTGQRLMMQFLFLFDLGQITPVLYLSFPTCKMPPSLVLETQFLNVYKCRGVCG